MVLVALVTLGIHGFSKVTGGRTFHPLVYGIGEGEREIVALHVFENLKVCLKEIFGIETVTFKGGITSDNTPVFVNAVAKAFPGCPQNQCYTHNEHHDTGINPQLTVAVVIERALHEPEGIKESGRHDGHWH